MTVNAFTSGLDHPRSFYVLPNGDVLVAETNAPPKPEDGKDIRGWAQKLFQRRAGAATPSPNRITPIPLRSASSSIPVTCSLKA
jgi:hypothetical protein